MRKQLFIILLLFFFSFHLFGQVVTIQPVNATTDSHVTITFNAALGNGDLAGYTGDVYTYTGVITTESAGNWDWKYVRNNWGEVNPSAKMTSLGNDLHQISFVIREFYGIPQHVKVVKLALLFHNADYTIVGRDENGGDIFVDINKESPGNYISHSFVDEKLTINTQGGLFEVRFFGSNSAKVEFIPNEVIVNDTSFTVVPNFEVAAPLLEEFESALSISTSILEVFISKYPVRFHFVLSGDTILSDSDGFMYREEGGEVSFRVATDESFYGGGSRATPVNRKGWKLRIYNEANYGYGNNTSTLNISIPFVVSSRGYGLFFDNQYPADLDLGSEDPEKVVYTTQGGRLRYYFLGGEGFDEVLANYTKLTGKQKLPPLWSLGYIQSKFGYQTETEARNIVNAIRQDGFPLDALILDLYWFGSTNDMGNLTWNYGAWSNPEGMISDFNEMGVKTILITEPYFTLNSTNYQYLANQGYLSRRQDGEPYVLWGFWAGDAALLDLTQEEAQDWMWNFYQARREEGVGGWWCDLGEPENHPHDMLHYFGDAKSVHNIYSLIWARFIDENYTRSYPDERLFNLIRSGYAGMQRYSTFPWSGDVQRTFSGLRAQIPIMLGAGMSGLGYMHSDVGGFVGSKDNELYTRWVQFGTFAPILRMHGMEATEPISYPEPYRSILRRYINLRYQLLPYNYTLAYENSTIGTPLARQLNYYNRGNTTVLSMNDSYLWGKNFLVAPVLERSASHRLVVFPEGKWLNFHSLLEYSGNQAYAVSVSLNDIPIFVRAGSFIPTTKTMVSTASYSSDSLIIKFYPDEAVPESSDYMFIDDGKSTSSLSSGEYELIHFDGLTLNNMISVDLSHSGNGFPAAPNVRNMQFDVYRVGAKPEKVEINGIEVIQVDSPDGFIAQSSAYFWDSDMKILSINFNWDGAPASIIIEKGVLSSDFILDMLANEFYLHNPYPNPFKENFTVTVDVFKPGRYKFSFHNTLGINLLEVEHSFSVGNVSFEMSFPKTLPSGVYSLTMLGNTSKQTRRIVK